MFNTDLMKYAGTFFSKFFLMCMTPFGSATVIAQHWTMMDGGGAGKESSMFIELWEREGDRGG